MKELLVSNVKEIKEDRTLSRNLIGKDLQTDDQ